MLFSFHISVNLHSHYVFLDDHTWIRYGTLFFWPWQLCQTWYQCAHLEFRSLSWQIPRYLCWVPKGHTSWSPFQWDVLGNVDGVTTSLVAEWPPSASHPSSAVPKLEWRKQFWVLHILKIIHQTFPQLYSSFSGCLLLSSFLLDYFLSSKVLSLYHTHHYSASSIPVCNFAAFCLSMSRCSAEH